MKGLNWAVVAFTASFAFYSNWALAGSQSMNQFLNGFNIYSPELVYQGSALRMYSGGWMTTGMVHDAIYRSSCPEPNWNGSRWVSGICSGTTKVIDAAANGFDALNDPSVIFFPGGVNGGYYIMYMTCVPAGQNGLNVTSNHICWSMSWANDGVNWSRPAVLTTKAWLPSAVRAANGRIYLYANSNGSDPTVPYLSRFDLGTSGVGFSAPTAVSVNGNSFYSNVNVVYRASLGVYQIFGEKDGATRIDYLWSADGVTWILGRENAVVPAPGQNRVNTPAPHPSNSAFMYYGQSPLTNSMGYSIFFNQWF